jgi:RNA polymerase sigma-70 factor (ECF subfamily)
MSNLLDYLNDKKNFRIIFNNFFQPLCHLSLQYLADEDEAKEVVQDAFLKLWEIRDEINPDSNLRNFLFTIVKNKPRLP